MTYEVGDKKPPEHTRFKKGQSGNPGGKTKEQKKAEITAGEVNAKAGLLAAQLRLRGLESITRLLDGAGDNAAQVVEAVAQQATLTLMRDSEDRAFGKPKQATELSGPDKGPIKTEEVTGGEKLQAFLDSIAARTQGGDG